MLKKDEDLHALTFGQLKQWAKEYVSGTTIEAYPYYCIKKDGAIVISTCKISGDVYLYHPITETVFRQWCIQRQIAMGVVAKVTGAVEQLPVESDNTSQLAGAMRFNNGKLQWSLVHFKSLEPMVKVLEFGAQKYDRDNWKKGLGLGKVMESMMRHVAAIMDGEITDPESGLPHIGHIMCNAMFWQYEYEKYGDSIPEAVKQRPLTPAECYPSEDSIPRSQDETAIRQIPTGTSLTIAQRAFAEGGRAMDSCPFEEFVQICIPNWPEQGNYTWREAMLHKAGGFRDHIGFLVNYTPIAWRHIKKDGEEEKKDDWKPIDTIPRDGTTVRVRWSSKADDGLTATWKEKAWYVCSKDETSSHWGSSCWWSDDQFKIAANEWQYC